MYSFLHELLSDKKDGVLFSCFDIWHLTYIVLALAAAFLVLYRFKNKPAQAKEKMARILITSAFGLYVADFFLMPLAYNEIDIEKLPFHACTAMCVMCFLSYHINFLAKYRSSFVLLGFISNLVYLIYPAGLMWHQVAPFSYRVIQTLLFHGLMAVYGLFVLVYEAENFRFKHCYRDLFVLAGMTLWAILGNSLYNGTSEHYSHFFNWFFVVRDPFYLFPEAISPYIMPFVNIALFFGVEMLVYLILHLFRKKNAV